MREKRLPYQLGLGARSPSSGPFRTGPSSLCSSTSRPRPLRTDRSLRRRRVAIRRLHIGEVYSPFAIGSGRREGALEHVGSDGGDLPLTRIGWHSTPPSGGLRIRGPAISDQSTASSLNSRANFRHSVIHLLLLEDLTRCLGKRVQANLPRFIPALY
jgi:hypothetical protein